MLVEKESVKIPNDIIEHIIKADKFSSPNAIFQGEHGECKRADNDVTIKLSGFNQVKLLFINKSR
ncbi:MAG TPA: hypothetical protein DEG17_07695 [Cyanobacteria bacterium UBA11149]|nr:hypothetical protein [Cyanobacteria bacterium UBA11367]HBE58155.1 hypothetical protein [Cyanobacteria bacterium UBA11366]HBK64145.1 hypothetical protein [Cyanobacteria bacterium UBA11166]HBR75473.1 hypothetical protein [Cyanobacteria bacterium UBA11159]HBS71125.1 hypothetical protein [Cyanobacteria bacterium UBA11153]HBW88745.1 hypothetical protein [Cyanobacteria bacterium UBA11149]HCA94398.1 hypothetical protein [Cyanobacteria bacterium UBA9226]